MIIASFAIALMFIISVPFIFGGEDDDGNFTDNGVIGAGEVCEIVETATGYMSLDSALAAVSNGQTIRLLSGIIYNDGIVISGKTVILDLNGYVLTVDNASGMGLYVEANGELILNDTGAGNTGTLNVAGTTQAVYADGGKATVTYASGGVFGAYATNGGEITVENIAFGGNTGAYAEEGGKITVNGSAEGMQLGAWADNGGEIAVKGMVSGTYDTGAYAVNGGGITAEDNVFGGIVGVYAVNGGTITVKGSVLSDTCGAYADGGTITVKGNSTGGDVGVYSAAGGTVTVEGYVTGTSNKGAETATGGTITVEGHAKGGNYGAYAYGGTITVESANGENITGAHAENGGTVIVETNVYGFGAGAHADGGTITVKGNAVGEGSTGAHAENGGTVTVEGYVYGGYTGAYAATGGTVTVEGHAIGVSFSGVYAADGGTITVGSYAESGYHGAYSDGGTVILKDDAYGGFYGAYAENGGTITVEYDAYGDLYGAYAENGGTITVKGDATGMLYGVYAYSGGIVTVMCDAEAYGDHGTGAHADGGTVTVGRALSSSIDGRGVCAENGGTITVNGDVKVSGGYGIGAYARDNGEIVVTGDVEAAGDNGIGAYVFNGGKITIDGEMTADIFIFLWSEVKIKSDGVIVTDGAKAGYWYYCNDDSEVWVKMLEACTVTISVMNGVTAPLAGATPVTTITETPQYTGTVTWDPTDLTFTHGTVYTATITLTPKGGYTFIGVGEDFFSVDRASCTNDADSGVVTAMFPATPATITISAIDGVTVPVAGAAPVTAITETSQYTGTVIWAPSPSVFDHNTVYMAQITLTPKSGYTLTGVPANFFTVAGTTAVGNTAGSGSVTLVFPATAPIKDVMFSAEANGSATATSTKITITFDTAVTGLTADDIIIPGTGTATKGALTPVGGDGMVYELALTVTATGYITVGISLTGYTFSPESTGADTTWLYLYVTHAVAYDLNTGTGSAPTESNKAAGAMFSAAQTTGMTAPDGKQFKHWNTVADGSGAVYAAGSTVTMPANAITLYAIWEDTVTTGGPVGDGGTDGGGPDMLIIIIIVIAAVTVFGTVAYFLFARKEP